jgi:hypothetical protein
MIVTGAVLSMVLDFLQGAPVVGIPVSVFAIGFFAAFYLSVVATTITGDDGVPDWPSVTDFMDDILMPFLRMVGLVLLSFGPAFAVIYFVDEKAPAFWWAFGGAAAWGCLYFPMALLGSVVCGNLFGALPHIVLPAIFRALPGYLLAVPGLMIAAVVCAIAGEYSQRVPYLGWFLAAALSIYSMMMQARVVGLIYRRKREALGWE